MGSPTATGSSLRECKIVTLKLTIGYNWALEHEAFSVLRDHLHKKEAIMGCCCTCNVVCVSLLSLLLSSPLLAPIVLSNIPVPSSNVTDASTFPTTTTTILHSALSWLHVIPNISHQDQVIDQVTKQELDVFIDGLIYNVEQTSVVTLTIACLNIVTNIFLMIGSCCKLSCLLLPWLVVSMVELLTIAVPATIFFSLLGVYLYFKGILLASILVTAVPATFLLVSLIMWFIVLAAYNTNNKKQEVEGYPVWPRFTEVRHLD